MSERPEAYVDILEEAGANWGERRGRSVVRDFDEGDAEYWHIRRDGAALVDRMARDTLVLTGDETVPWLQGLVTSDLLELREVGSGLWTVATNVNGRIVSDLRVVHLPQMLYCDLEPATLEEGFRAHLDQQIIMEDVTLSNRTAATGRLGVHGPGAAPVVEAAGTWRDSVDTLEAFDATWGTIRGEDVIVQRIRWTGEPGLELAFDRERAAEIWNELADVDEIEVRPAGERALETARIEAGVPRFGEELDDDIIPLEAGLRDKISFEKGCYVGQEVIARLDTQGTPAKKLRTLVFDGGAAPRVGAPVEDGDREVGEVVNAVWSPLLDAPIALAYIRRGSNDVGSRLEVEGRETSVEELGHPLARN